MDSTVLGVIIGSGVSLLGTVLSQYFLSQKEQKQWENQQVAENKAWTRDEQKAEIEYLREVYQNSLRSLSVFIALEEQKTEESETQKRLDAIDEVHKWTTMLLLRHSSSNLDRALNSFTADPDKYAADDLRKEIIALSNQEDGFFLNGLKEKPETNEPPIDTDLRKIKFKIDNVFREEQIIAGTELPQSHSFQFKLSEMKSSQRKLLTEIFFQSHKCVPQQFALYVPILHPQSKRIHGPGKQWEASLNPYITEPSTILETWENNYLEVKAQLTSQEIA